MSKRSSISLCFALFVICVAVLFCTVACNSEASTFTVTYRNMSNAAGSLLKTEDSAAQGTSLVLPGAVPNSGYVFSGYFTDSEGSTLAGMPGSSYTVSGDTVLYALWETGKYTVEFDSQGGSAVSGQTVEYGHRVTEPEVPERKGYRFLGWFLDNSPYNFDAPVTNGFTLTAGWQELYSGVINIVLPEDVYAIVDFDTCGGSYVSAQVIEKGKTAVLPETKPRYNGKSFAGWSLTQDGSAGLYDFSTPVLNDMTLYALWETAFCTVSFESNGGTVVESQSVEYGKKAVEPSAPARSGYEFKGWVMEGTEGAFSFALPVTSDTKLIAVWEIVYITVTFDPAGGSAVESQSVAYGSKASEPQAPGKTGHTFSDWYLNGAAYNFSTAVTHNITLTAKWTKNKYAVAFDSTGGSAVESQNVEYQNTASKPADPTKTGYTFSGWYLNSTAYDFSTAVTQNITLAARWAKEKYTVTFDSAGGSDVAGQSVEYQNTASKPADPARTGYTFSGWYLNGAEYDFSTAVTQNVTLTAQWTKNNYTVTFNSDGGTSVISQTVEYQGTATKPTDPTRTGYTFSGWYLNGTGYDFSKAVTQNLSLTARWTVNRYTVTFNSNGGTAVASQTVEYGKTASRPADPKLAGKTFSGWAESGSSVLYNFSSPVASDITLVAQWNTAYCTVTFDSNGGSTVPAQSVASGGTASRPSDPTRTGYTFTGWYLNGTVYNFSTGVTQNITLTAHWTKNNYTVTFNSNGGTSVTSQTVEYQGTATKPSNPTRTGYTFNGWYLNSTVYNFGTAVTKNITLTAQWTKNKYTVTFNSNGGTSVTSQTVEYQGTATKPSNPTRTGYTFNGWYLNGTEYVFSTAVTQNITLAARWTKNSYTVTFNSDGGTSVTSQTVEYQGTATKPADPTKTGYTFSGWYLNGTAYNFSTAVTQNITLTARWTKIKYTVSFNTDGGSAVSSQSVEYQGKVSKPTDPTKTGYSFSGWYLNGAVYDFNTAVTSGITLKAQWTPKTVTVAYVMNGHGTAPSAASGTYGSAFTASAPSASGYSFDGWYKNSGFSAAWTNGTVLTAANGVSSDMTLTLYAKWTARYDFDSTYHWYGSNSKEKHSLPSEYEVDGKNGRLKRECDVCGYVEYTSSISVPSGKNLYTLTVYSPESYTGTTTANFTLKGTGTSSKSLVQASAEYIAPQEDTAGSTTFDDWDVYPIYYREASSYTANAWFENETSKTRFYRQESVINTPLYSGLTTSQLATLWAYIEYYFNQAMNEDILARERKLFGLDAWDVDGDGYFRIVFEDFGTSYTGYNGSSFPSGNIGAYWVLNTYYSDPYPSNWPSSNNSDVFFINARYIEYVYHYYSLRYSNAAKLAAATAIHTLVHEYLHYLQDACVKGYGKNRSANQGGSQFWQEGLGNYTKYAVLGRAYYGLYTAASGHVNTWLKYMDKYRPGINYSDNTWSSSTSSGGYGGGALFFTWVQYTYGQNAVNAYVASTTDNLNTNTEKILGNTFSSVYTRFLIDMMNSLNSSTPVYWSDFGITKTNIDAAVQDTSYGSQTNFTVSNYSSGFSYSGLNELSFVINKWTSVPSMITLDTSNSGLKTYVFYI